jgi:hypothetical protein
MPIHDWTKIPAGLFHHFHQDWCVEIARTLNRGRLPKGLSALVEQQARPWEPDVLAIERPGRSSKSAQPGGLAIAENPRTQIIRKSTNFRYAERANRIVIKHHLGRIVAIIEIVSPGNKDSKKALQDFLKKTIEFLSSGIHVLVVDLFPPTRRDPAGIHRLIWDEFEEEEVEFSFPPGKDRILASYQTGREHAAYVEPIAVGDAMPDMPLFISSDLHVKIPLEATYQTTWEVIPEEMKRVVETGVLPEDEEE